MSRFVFLLLVGILVSPNIVRAQGAPPSCEEQLVIAHSTLFFTRTNRHASEEHAGRVVMELQKQLADLRHELERLHGSTLPEKPAPKEKNGE